ncbi:hypothetical protein N5C39_22475 [Enterobacter bugandensis]|uniref:Uncharacterized protein n=1 Tax=Enterobacter bugandensis TaxID=881260 RepID=A0AA42PUS9_9ENTR|nr:hypothetical protein [Enterobacter bugandensis]MDH1321141.1 hypothetical protein [Enterobacter bugandensis]
MQFTKEQLIALISQAGEWAEIYEHPIHDKPKRDFFEGMARALTAYLAVLNAPPAPVVPELCTAIEALLDMHVRMVKQTNHSASFFDSETISAMNYAPIKARQALELAKPYK